jgi:carbon monoxide dehydrogenase subunit G
VKLADIGFLAGCLPDAEVLEASPDQASWKVRPQLAFLSGTIDTFARVVERLPTERVKVVLETKSVGAGSTVEAVLTLTSEGTGTKVAWTGTITSMSGLLKLAPKALLQSTAKKVIGDTWTAIKKHLP